MVIIIQRHYAFLYLLAVLSVLLLCLIPLANFPSRAVRTESNAPITPLYKEGIIILMYHDVNFDTTVEGTIAPVLFEAQSSFELGANERDDAKWADFFSVPYLCLP